MHMSVFYSNQLLRLIAVLAFLQLYSCDSGDSKEKKDLPPDMNYSYECLNKEKEENKVKKYLEKADDFINDLASERITVTDEEMNQFGEKFYKEVSEDKSMKIDEEDPFNEKLKTVLKQLLDVRPTPSGIKYRISLLRDDTLVNAFTAGGQIFITTGMIKKMKNDAQLYAILGHEIGHNERGHIKLFLQQQKLTEKYLGEWAETVIIIRRLLTMSFNQKKELEADYYGLDLTWKLGMDVCSINSFWEDLAKTENPNKLEDFFRSHPYSDVRSSCLRNHVQKNFDKVCEVAR
jgi:beta-barrel assembly-enhancing protease